MGPMLIARRAGMPGAKAETRATVAGESACPTLKRGAEGAKAPMAGETACPTFKTDAQGRE